ncbi:TIGR01244 family sulfur transferase [Roseobacter sinensis]|uniref:TIGR01244 family sulfur transferase n=1 Tax=Roseobacter sinensis TaxID=2931391 RepID=A0ABT3BKM2_9RHOB|nr:TIGR01244 family sulfur transferase [Roseobacter sp. WL0113]MCV3274120.1 TIGR01244 family sulfur transferase [Roseobacter sp. WL0113]
MDMRQITPDFFAAPQVDPEDMDAIAAAGIRRVVCNRPDAEVPPSHQSDVMRQAAEAVGLEFAMQPLTHQTMTPDVIAANHALIGTYDGPVLAYCASGTRSTIAWALAAARDMPAEEVIEAAAKGGYDLRNLFPTLTAIGNLPR